MEKSIYKQFWQYTLPTVAAMLVNGLYQVVDGIFIGRYMGAEGLAGINVVWPIIGTVMGVGMMVGVGTGALASIHTGSGNRQKARTSLSTGLVLLLITYPVLVLTLWRYSEFFLLAQGIDGNALAMGSEYIEVLVPASFFTLGSIAIPFLLRNDGRPHYATFLMVLGALLNIVFDYLFIVRFGWELKGAALATALSQCVVTLMGVGYFFSKYATMRLRLSRFTIRFAEIPQILAIGSSSMVMYLYGSVMVAVHNWMFTQYGTVLTVGAYAVLGYILVIYYLTAEGIANGMQPLVSFNHGAKNGPAVKQLFSIACWSSILVGIVFVTALNVYPEEIIGIFNGDDPELMRDAVMGIRLHMFAVFLDGFIVVVAAYYQAIGDSKKAMFTTVGNMVIQFPFLYIFSQLFGLTGVWLAYPISNIALSVVLIWMIRKEKSLYQ
jgi:putative MATE family efflux protein